MSYILDALQKSEAERHQENLPAHMIAGRPLLYRGRRRNAVWPWLLAVLLMINAGFLGYYVLKPQPAVEAGIEVSSGRLNPTPPAQPQMTQPVIVPKVTEAASVEKAKAASEAQDPLTRVRAAIAQQRAQQPVEPVEAESFAPAEPVDPEAPLLITPGAPPKTFNETMEPAPETVAEVPDISSLDVSFQRQVPPLEFNSHIYSSDPQGRRIMINSHYLREGQSFQGMKVVEITETGVVLNRDGQTFRVSVVRNWSPQ